jgi:hypothetical protein
MTIKPLTLRSVLPVTENRANDCQFVGHHRLLTTPLCLPVVLIVVLGLVLAGPAEARTGELVEAIGSNGSIWAELAWTAAALLVLAIAFIHELSVILDLCPFAGQANDAKTESAELAAYGFARPLCKSNQKDVSCETSGF